MNLVYITSFIVMPKDTQSSGRILFGGKILSEMDLCAAHTARRLLYDAPQELGLLTVAVKDINMMAPAFPADLVFLRGQIVKLGTTSIEIQVVAWKEDYDGSMNNIAIGTFVLVSTIPWESDEEGNGLTPRAHGLKLIDE